MAALRDFEAFAAAGHPSAAPAPPREDRGEGRGAWMADAARSVSDLALVARCRAGERLAWKAVYEAHFDFVYRVARRLGTPAAEAEDVCQEVFLVAFRRVDLTSDVAFSRSTPSLGRRSKDFQKLTHPANRLTTSHAEGGNGIGEAKERQTRSCG